MAMVTLPIKNQREKTYTTMFQCLYIALWDVIIQTNTAHLPYLKTQKYGGKYAESLRRKTVEKRRNNKESTKKKTEEKLVELNYDEAALENHITKFHFKFRQN